MPERVITKPPSAELREDQKDQDSCRPTRSGRDPQGLVEGDEVGRRAGRRRGRSRPCCACGAKLDRAEYKRRQAPPGVKITPRAFGRDRRYPITNLAMWVRRSAGSA
jgi:NAD+ synthase